MNYRLVSDAPEGKGSTAPSQEELLFLSNLWCGLRFLSLPADPKDRQIVAENVMPQRVGAAPVERTVQLNEAKFGDRIMWWTKFSDNFWVNEFAGKNVIRYFRADNQADTGVQVPIIII